MLVGATFTGVDVAEFLHAATIAVVGEVPLDRLWHAVPLPNAQRDLAEPARSIWAVIDRGYMLNGSRDCATAVAQQT